MGFCFIFVQQLKILSSDVTPELYQLLGDGGGTGLDYSFLVFVLVEYQLKDSQLQAHEAFKIIDIEFGKI